MSDESPLPLCLSNSRGVITEAVEAHDFDVTVAHWLYWRIEKQGGRKIYAQLGPEPSDSDPQIGDMSTTMLAHEAVHAHNEALKAVQR